jgi:hypothetical protein
VLSFCLLRILMCLYRSLATFVARNLRFDAFIHLRNINEATKNFVVGSLPSRTNCVPLLYEKTSGNCNLL